MIFTGIDTVQHSIHTCALSTIFSFYVQKCANKLQFQSNLYTVATILSNGSVIASHCLSVFCKFHPLPVFHLQGLEILVYDVISDFDLCFCQGVQGSLHVPSHNLFIIHAYKCSCSLYKQEKIIIMSVMLPQSLYLLKASRIVDCKVGYINTLLITVFCSFFTSSSDV